MGHKLENFRWMQHKVARQQLGTQGIAVQGAG